MLFNSYGFICLFLPITFIVYYVLNKHKLILVSKAWLVLASLFFYGFWNPIYIPLIIGSMLFNYLIGWILVKKKEKWFCFNRKVVLIFGVLGDLALLGYYKYSDFLISNINDVLNSEIASLQVILPLGISFFTFTQIAYLVDTYKGTVKEYNLLNYSLFVTFFPHLLAGPIIHHKEMMPQFDSLRNKILDYRNLYMGLCLFFIGLFKKVVIADTFSIWAKSGFDNAITLTFLDAWTTSLSYTFQIYFDFSGYTDMALGSALIFNIKLPINFNSPYKALNIQDFWRRWHITLSRFLRDYIYIPIGGNRISEFRTLANLMTTFLIGGLWHGAGWTFILWGFLHGFATVIHRLWMRSGINMPKILAWFITFNFVNITWVFFRAREFKDATKILKGMFDLKQFVMINPLIFVALAFGLIIVLAFKNSNYFINSKMLHHKVIAIGLAVIAVISIVILEIGSANEFLYFQF
jgi:alginate O-acetyltransferase complex protein AlgI